MDSKISDFSKKSDTNTEKTKPTNPKITDLSEKVVIITGASRGIGRAIAYRFAENGAIPVLIYSKSDKDMDISKAHLEEMGANYYVFKGSVTDKGFAKEVVTEVKRSCGAIDVLVNNAGIIKDKPLMMMSESDWDDVIDVNLKGAFILTKEVIRPMYSQKSGRIINISSLTAIAGREAQTNYGASKAGLIGFTKSLAREVGNKGILVNAIVAGLIDTTLIKKVPREIIQQLREFIPLRRIGHPEEVANAVLFLSSELSSYITGSVLNVSGGEYM
jgi:3-oxoacyl-[acyl-carrier protein] reductase